MRHLMRRFRAVLMRIVGLRTRDADETRMREEMAFHLDELAERYMKEGLSPDEARRRARIAFGCVEAHKETSRDVLRSALVENTVRDIRHALRALRRRPGFTAGVALTLALGIGANAAMFSIVDRLLFRPPPMLRVASRVHRVYLAKTDRGTETWLSNVAYQRFVDLTRDTRSFARTALVDEEPLAVGSGTDAREMPIGIVSAGFFSFFDAAPRLGRYFTTAEDTPPTGAPVAVLSYAYWEARYGARHDVIGQVVQIGPTRYTVVGVAPKGFVGIWPDRPPAAFVPVTVVGNERGGARFAARGQQWWHTYGWWWAEMIVERKSGVSVAAATADLTRADRRSYLSRRAASPGMPPLATARPHALAAPILRERGPNETSLTKVATWIEGVVVVVWLIACLNVATLLLVRALERRRDIAIRLALGASRFRVARQLLTEVGVLAVLGGAGGLLLAQWGGTTLRSTFLPSASATPVVTDTRTLIYTGAATLIAALFTGLVPLLQTRRMSVARDVRIGARGGTHQRSPLRTGLLLMQSTLSVLLLVGAGLFVRSLGNVRAVPLGYQPEHVAFVQLNMRGTALDSARSVALHRALLARARAIPGVTNAARQISIPFWSSWSFGLTVPGIDSVDQLGTFDMDAVSPDYFATMGTRILRGRGIGPEDVEGAPGAIVVSEAMAEKLWPGQNPLGKCVRVWNDEACRYVVGVAENIKNDQIGDDPGLYYYLSSAQFFPHVGGLFVRVQGDPDAMREPIRRALQPLMPGAAYLTVMPLADVLGQQTQSWRIGATLFALFGCLALALAAIGLYSVIAFDVAQRTHELGVRVALGATTRNVVGDVVTGGVRLAAVGMALGVGVALVAGRWVKPLLFQESPQDPVVFGIVAAVLLGVAALASYVPARRAARVNPVVVLREE